MACVLLWNCAWRFVTLSDTEKKSIASQVHASQLLGPMSVSIAHHYQAKYRAYPERNSAHWVGVSSPNTVSRGRACCRVSLLGRRFRRKIGAIVTGPSLDAATERREAKSRSERLANCVLIFN